MNKATLRKIISGPIVLLVIFGVYKIHLNQIKNKQRAEMEKSMGFSIKEISKELGIDHLHRIKTSHPNYKNVAPWIESSGAGLTIADLNNDNYMDIILNGNELLYGHRLYINDQKGKFLDRTEQYKINKRLDFKYQSKIIAFDCNNDSYQDLFILADCSNLYMNSKGQHFEDYTKQSGLAVTCGLPPAMAAISFDYDKDGNLDLIFGSYFANDPFYDGKNSHGLVPDNFNDSKNAAPIYLMKGNGKCQFSNKSELIPPVLKERGWFLDVGVGDIFQNGDQDLWFVTDYGISHPARFISIQKGWKDESDLVDKPSKTRNSMGYNMSDIDHVGVNNVFLPNIFHPREKVNGNLLWVYDKKTNAFIERARDYNAHGCGWSWGSQFVDLNNDTWDDIVVTNGMFGDGSSPRSYWYNLSVLDASGRTFMSNIKNWPDMSKFDLNGGEKDCLFINLGNGRGFAEVSETTDFDSGRKNGRGVGYIDINNDGIYSLVVVNQGDFSRVYKATPLDPFTWVGLHLKTANNNSFAIGAKVSWRLSNGETSFKEMRPMQGYMAQNDPRFRLGFPQNVQLESLFVTWLDGKKEQLDLKTIKMNQYNEIIKR